MVRQLLTLLTYMRRGHSLYGAYILQLANFAMILSLYLHVAAGVDALIAVPLVIPAYLVAATLLGYLDFRRGQFVVESLIAAKYNPVQLRSIELALYTSLALAELAERAGLKELADEIRRRRESLAKTIYSFGEGENA